MKEIKIALISVVVLLIFVACASMGNEDTLFRDYYQYELIQSGKVFSAYKSTEHADCVSDNDSKDTLLASGPHFRVLRVSSLPNPIYYRFEIYNRNGELVKYEYAWRTHPQIRYIDENILEISISAGTNTIMVQFYSISDDMFSDVFQTTFLITNEIIAYVQSHGIIFRDIFDATTYYKIVSFDNFTFTKSPFSAIINIEYLDEGIVKVTYWSEKGFVEKTIAL